MGALAVVSSISCAGGSSDQVREERPYKQKATLGQEIYGVLCDRLGASVLGEDLSGRSYHGLCHPDAEGNYQDHVDTTVLPPVSGAAAVARNLAVAKLETLARRRAETIKALDVIVPDIEIDDPYPPGGTPRKVRLHEAMADFLTRLNPLYDSNPLAVEGGDPVPLLPAATQALARLFAQMEKSEASRRALAHIGGRKGYHPAEIGLGILGPVVAYPHLRKFSQQAVRILSPGGAARPQLVQLLKVLHQEMRTAETKLPLGPYVVQDPNGIAQPNRAMDTWELANSVLLATDPSFAPPGMKSGWVALRDYRGFALVTGSSFGKKGSVPAPFTDADGDGLADVDAFGRFIGPQGQPAAIDYPFVVPGEPRVRPPDPLGRALMPDGKTLAYQYIDTTHTLAAAMLQDVGALLDPDPANDHETLLNAMAGLKVLLGDRKQMTYTYGEGEQQQTINYNGFDPDTSPLVDLVYALGPVLADPQSDDFLQQLIDLLENHEQEVARVVGAALRVKDIADKHPEADLPDNSVFWDQMAEVLGRISQVGPANGDPNGKTLMENILLAFTDPRVLGLSETYSKFMTYRDVLNYDPNNINGPAINKTGPSGVPSTLVDRSKPAVGDNRSMFQRTIQMIFDSSHVTACSKKEAHVHLKAGVLGLSADMTYPDDLTFKVLCPGKVKEHLDWCDIFKIDDLTAFYIQSLIEDDPKLPASLNQHKAVLRVRDKCLTSLGKLSDMDKTFEDSSALSGMTTHPTHLALHRLVFFGADSTSLRMPDLDPYRDGKNKRTNLFISGLQEPMGTPLCPKNSAGVNVCSSPNETIRVRDNGTLFLWEHFGFADSNRPVLYPFYERGREDLFEDLIDVVHFHMDAAKDVPNCRATGSWRRSDPNFNPRMCYGDGLVRYEPLMAEALSKTDLIPALHALTKVVAAQKIHSVRYRKAKGFKNIDRRGTEVLASLVRILLDPVYSAKIGLTDRHGSKSVKWSDGKTVKPQVTPFDLAANALHGIDERFASAKDFSAQERADRHAKWLKARSQLVDQFLAVDGFGKNAHFRNRYVARALVRVLKVLRQQLNAHCPDREKGKACDWARTELPKKTADIIRDPLFAAVVDLLDAINQDPSHVELERFLQYLLEMVNNDDESVRKTLATVSEAVMVLRDGQTTPPLLNVLAPLIIPDDEQADPAHAGPGAVDVSLQLLNVLSRDVDDKHGPDDPLVFDRYHVLEHILPNLVKPIDDSANSKTAIEVLLDVALDVQRYDSSQQGPLTADDYAVIAKAMQEFLLSKTRGMEQLYTVVRGGDGN